MDIPETFKPKEFQGINLEYPKEPISDIESVIMEESFVDCTKKHIENWDVAYPSLINLGVNIGHIDKAIHVTYYDENRMEFGKYGVGPSKYTINLIEYHSKNILDKDLESLFDKGVEFYLSKDKFMERFLFKDKIAIYIDGNKPFIKKSVNYYRGLGFKQLSYTIKIV